MSSTEQTREVVARFFRAFDELDLDGMMDLWGPDSVCNIVGLADLNTPEEFRGWFGEIFRCFPDFGIQVEQEVVNGPEAAVHWQSSGTFSGKGTFEGLHPNGAQIGLRGVDFITVEDGVILSWLSVMNGMDLARQVGTMPARGSIQERSLTHAINTRNAVERRLRSLRRSTTFLG